MKAEGTTLTLRGNVHWIVIHILQLTVMLIVFLQNLQIGAMLDARTRRFEAMETRLTSMESKLDQLTTK